MTPVTECSSEPSSSTCPASAFTPTESRNASANTIVEWPRENQNPTDSGLRRGRRPASAGVVGHQLAGGVVDGRDVVGVERVPQAERVRQDADADGEDRVVPAEVVVVGHHEAEQHAEADDVQQDDEPVHRRRARSGPAGSSSRGTGRSATPPRSWCCRSPADLLRSGPVVIRSRTLVHEDAGCKPGRVWCRTRPGAPRSEAAGTGIRELAQSSGTSCRSFVRGA